MAIKISGTTVIDDTRNLTSINTTATGNVTVTGFANVSTTLAAGNTSITGFVNASTNVTSNTIYATNSFNVGTSFTANSTVVNAVSYNAATRIVANSTVVNATHLNGIAASSYYRSGSTDVALADGGTNASLTASAGAIAFSNTTSLALTAVGTSGQLLTSAGAGTPTWASTLTPNLTLSGNTIFSGSNTTVNAEFRVINSTANVFFVAANGGVGIGTSSTSTFKLSVNGSTTFLGNSYIDGANHTIAGNLNILNSLVKLNLGSTLSFDSGTGACTEIYASSNNLIISTPLNGNVGINNSSPVHRLSVNGTTFLGGAVSGITTLAAGNTTITGFMNVSSNLMIGSAPTLGPFAPTTIVSGTTVGQNYQISLSPIDGALGRESGIRFGATFSQGWGGVDFVSRYSGAISYGAAGGGATPRLHAMKFYTGDASDVPTERMRIDNTGNVGIGNTSPAHTLRVTGTTSLAGAVSDITTLAAGNTTITGTLSVSQNTTFSNGVNFGSAVAASSTDLSRHVALWGTQYGLNVTGSTLNYITGSGASHAFNAAGTETMRSNTTGFYVGARFLANSTHANATHLNGVAHTGYLTTSGTAANATLLNNKTESNLNVNNATYVGSKDGDRNPNTKLPTTTPYSVRFDFVGAANANTGGNYAGVMTYAPWDGTTASTGDASYQLAFGSTAASGAGLPQLNIRKGIDSTWNTWYTLLHSGNYSSYALPLTGGTMSGIITSSNTVIAAGTASGATRGYLYNDASGFGLLSNTFAWALRVDYGSTNITVPSGILSIGDTTTSTGTRQLSIGGGRTGSGISLVDLVGDTTYTSYGSRFIRNAGANANTDIRHRGTGQLNLLVEDAGVIGFYTNGAYRGKVDGGTLFWGTTLNNANSTAAADAGVSITAAGRYTGQFDNGFAMTLNRTTSDGAIINFNQAGVNEGSIGVSGVTVSLTAFLGAHWGTLQNRERIDILPGTVLETIDALVEWKVLRFTDNNDKEIRVVYEGPEPIGTAVDYEYEGTVYQALVEYEDPNLELNKHSKVKISDTEASKAVFGVFLSWCNEENDYQTDMNVASVGNYFIRISGDYDVQIGDLIESNGDGTGRPQDDDIIRSKTIGKVTTTIKQKVYDDESYLVTAVLYCG